MRLTARSLLAMSLFLAACPPATTETLEITPTTLSLQTGETRSVSVQVKSGSTSAAAAGATWTSSDLAVVSVSSTGDGTAALQALAAGTATITAKLREASASLTVTVTDRAVTLTSLELTPASPSLAKGTMLQLTATGRFSDSTTAAVTDATWTSADESILTVDATGLVSGLLAGSAQVTATKGGVSATVTVTVTAATLVAVEVTPALPSLAKGTTEQLVATARFSDATTQDVTAQATWTSATETIVTVDAGGLATAVSVGSSDVTATLNGVSGSTTVTVTDAVLTAIDVTPAAPSVPLGLTRQLTATGRFSDNTTQDLTSQATWTSGTPATATVSTAGLVSTLALGTSEISAAFSGVTGATTVTVSAAELVSLAVTPEAPSLARGLTLDFTATGTFSDNTTQDLTDSVVWSSSAPTTASISNAPGSKGRVTAQAAGNSTITATSGTISDGTTLTVTAATVASLQVSPTTPSVPKGLTQSFTAMGLLTDGSMQDVTSTVTWTTGTAAVATISNAPGSEGLLTTVSEGSSTVTATLGAVSDSTSVTVTAARLDRIDVTPVAPQVALGRTLQLTATGVYSDGSTQPLTTQVTWVANPGTVATISNVAGSEGLLSTALTGNVTVTATLNTVSGSQPVTVTAAELSSLAVTPALPSIARGRTQQFVAMGTFSDNTVQNLTTQVTWSTGTAATATISNVSGSEGLATSLDVGTTTVVATSSGVSGQTTLTVTAAELVSIAITGAPATLPRGRTANLVATGTYTDGSTQPITTQVTWSASPTSIATISNVTGSNGRVTAVAVGTATFTATLSGVSQQVSLDVTAAVLESLAITPATLSIAKGRTQQFTALGTYSDGTTQPHTDDVTWSSTASSALSISNAPGSRGLATALELGVGDVTAQLSGVTGTASFSVTPAVMVSIAVTPTNPTSAKGLTRQFTATATFTDSSTMDITTQVTWSSGTQSVAVISNAPGSEGLATAAAEGTSRITADAGSISGFTDFTVGPAALVSIAVTPATPTLSLGSTQQFTATGTFTDSTTRNLTAEVTWTSSDPSVGISNAAGSEGRATADALGTSTVSATSGSISGSTVVTVSNATLVSIAVTPASSSLAKGRTAQFVAMGTYSNSTTADVTTSVTWSTGAAATATVSNTAGSEGLVTAVAEGTTTVIATLGSVSGNTGLTVTPAELVSIIISGVPASPLPLGRTADLVATGVYTDSSMQTVTTSVTWASADANVASVSNTSPTQGRVTAVALGTVNITASLSGVTGNASLTTAAAELVSIEVTPANPTINLPGTQQLVATGTFSDNTTLVISGSPTTWVSETPANATVNTTGNVTGVAPGTSLITATRSGITGSTTVTVVAPPPAVSSTVPASGATGVWALAPISVTFDRTITTASVTTQQTQGPCSGSLQVSRDEFATCIGLSTPTFAGNTATTTPTPALSFGATYKVRVTTSVTSSFGTPMAATFTHVDPFTTAVDARCGTGLLISQLYGAGGNAGAVINADYVELHNPTTAPISLSGYAIQYASASGSSWIARAMPTTASVPAGGYFLVQMNAAGANGVALPTPDHVTTNTDMAGANGKVALTNTTTALSGACPTGGAIADFVGYGTANCSEGTLSPAPALSASTAGLRKNTGCSDDGNNATDFLAGTPSPRNSAAANTLLCACTLNESDVPGEADFCNLQHPPSTAQPAGTPTESIYARVFENGLTQPAGSDPSVLVQIGYGPVATNPQNQPGWIWTSAAFNVQIGNDDEYRATLTVPAAGTYWYASRFSLDNINWTYCDLNGAGGNAGLSFDPSRLGGLTVTP